MRQVRQLAKYYLRVGEDVGGFIVRAMKVVRLLFEESFRRCLMSAVVKEDRLICKALCGMVCTMRNFEEDTIGGSNASDLGCWWSFTEASVRHIAMKVGHRKASSIEDMPSWLEVSRMHDRSPDCRAPSAGGPSGRGPEANWSTPL